MKTLNELKKQKESKVEELFKSCGVFFAFNNEQFETSKTPLTEGDKYVRFASGSYVPKSKINNFTDGFELIENEYQSEIKNNNLRRKEIAYELGNHECYYTGDIQSALDALGDSYSKEEVLKVYKEERKYNID